MTDDDIPSRQSARDDDTLGEGTYVFGGRHPDDDAQPSDADYVWERFAIDSSEEHGVETRGEAALSDQARQGAKQAIQAGKVSNGALAKSTTTQQRTDKRQLLSKTTRGFYRPPYDPTALANLAQKNGTHARCVSAKAQAVAGHGFSLIADEDYDGVDDTESDEDVDPDGMDAARDFWFGQDTRFQLGQDSQPATREELLSNVWWDYEGVGWGCIEFLVNRSAEPTGLAHVPAHRIRKRVDAPGYVELDDNGRILQYYSEVGLRYDTSDDNFESTQQFIDRWTGEVSESANGVSEVANELLFIPNYNPLTPHYGLPDVVPEIQTIVADLAARRYNARFFENDGVPRFVVSVEGGELTKRAYENLRENLRELSKEENSHRGMLIEAVDAVQRDGDANDVTVDITPLTVGEQEDASFIQFRQENEHDIIKAHSVPPVVVSRTEGSNYSNSRQQRQEFAQSTVRPRQERFAARLQQTLHSILLDAPGVGIDFELRGGQNRKREAEIAQLKLRAGGISMTVNEWREELNLGPLETENGDPDPLGEMLVAELQGLPGLAGGMGGGGAPVMPEGGDDESTPDAPATPSGTQSPPGTPTDGDGDGDIGESQPAPQATARASDPTAPPSYDILSDDERVVGAGREAAASSKYADYSQGDMVSYGSGDSQNGLVLEVFTGDFTWPGTDGEDPVTATQDNPLYVVARAAGGSGVYEESELSDSTFLDDEDDVDPSELADKAKLAPVYDYVDDPNDLDEIQAAQRVIERASIPGVDDPGVGFDSLPKGWNRLSVLKAWRSLGMTFTSCVRDMRGEIRSPKRFCAVMKDSVYGTEDWRGGF